MGRVAGRKSVLGIVAVLWIGMVGLLLAPGIGGASAKHPNTGWDKFTFQNLNPHNAWGFRVVFEHEISIVYHGWPDLPSSCEIPPQSDSNVVKCADKRIGCCPPIKAYEGQRHPDDFPLKVAPVPPRTHVRVDHWYWEDKNGDRLGASNSGCDKPDGCTEFNLGPAPPGE